MALILLDGFEMYSDVNAPSASLNAGHEDDKIFQGEKIPPEEEKPIIDGFIVWLCGHKRR